MEKCTYKACLENKQLFFLEDSASYTVIQMYFCKGYDYGEKVDLTKGYWNPKRKMWVTTHFSEIIQSAECYLRVFLSFNLQYLRYERRGVVKFGVSVFVLYNACATE